MYKTFPLLSFFLFGLEKRSAQVEVTGVFPSSLHWYHYSCRAPSSHLYTLPDKHSHSLDARSRANTCARSRSLSQLHVCTQMYTFIHKHQIMMAALVSSIVYSLCYFDYHHLHLLTHAFMHAHELKHTNTHTHTEETREWVGEGHNYRC